jgi:hypothetical protein
MLRHHCSMTAWAATGTASRTAGRTVNCKRGNARPPPTNGDRRRVQCIHKPYLDVRRRDRSVAGSPRRRNVALLATISERARRGATRGLVAVADEHPPQSGLHSRRGTALSVVATKLSVHYGYVFRIDRNDGEPWVARAFPP